MRQMLANMKARREREEGFTLIELMVVVLIIAILIAIAIPTFLGARQRAQERAAQSSLRNAVTAAKTLYTDNENFNSIDITSDATVDAALTAVEPSLDYVIGDSTGPKIVSVLTGDLTVDGNDDYVVMAGLSKSNTCFYILDVVAGSAANDGTFFSEGAATACAATDAPAVGNVLWTADGW